MKYCPYNHVWMCKLIINHVLYSCLRALTSAPIFTFSWGPLRPRGGSTTTAPTSFHNQPRSCGTHYTLNLDYNGSLSFNNIFFSPHLSNIFTLHRFTPVSEMYQKLAVCRCTRHSTREMVFWSGKNHFKHLQHVLYQPSNFLLKQICLTLPTTSANITYTRAKKHIHSESTVRSSQQNNTKTEEFGAAWFLLGTLRYVLSPVKLTFLT